MSVEDDEEDDDDLGFRFAIPITDFFAGFDYQQHLVPGMRPGGGLMPNFFVLIVQQGQRMGGRRGAGLVQQNQQHVPMMQQQVCLCLTCLTLRYPKVIYKAPADVASANETDIIDV